MASICLISPMWQAMESALPPFALIFSSTVFNASIFLLARTQCAPFSASVRAMASPIPRLAPVIKATLSCNEKFTIIICSFSLVLLILWP